MDVKTRLKQYLKYENLPVSSFEKAIDVANGYVNSISKSIGVDKIELIVEKFPKLNIEWLLAGKGSMLKKNGYDEWTSEPFLEKFPSAYTEVVNAKNDVITILQRQVDDLTNDKLFLQKIIETKL